MSNILKLYQTKFFVSIHKIANLNTITGNKKMKTTKRTVELLYGTTLAIRPDNYYRHPLLYNVVQSGYIIGGLKHSVSRAGYNSFGLYGVVKGKVVLKTKNKTYKAHAGDTLFFSQEDAHTVVNGGDIPYEAYFAYLYGPEVKGFYDSFQSKFGCVMTDFIPPSLETAVQQTTAMIQSGNENKYLISSLLYNVLTELLQKCDESDGRDGITDAIKYVMEHYKEKITLDTLSSMAYTDKFYFIRQFHSLTGFTPKEYQNELRLNEALSLLKNTDLSVTAIAKEVGFSDARGLIALIKSRKGCSPSQLRKK